MHPPRVRPPLLLALVLAGAFACDGDDDDDGGPFQPSSLVLFGPAIRRVVLEVDYQAGGEPFTGSVPPIDDVWDIFGGNAERMFAAGGKAIEFPRALEEMEEITDVDATTFTTQQVLDLATLHRDRYSSSDTAAFYALWLDGHFMKDGEVQYDVLGITVGDTGVIALFKPVIRRASFLGSLESFVEQTTLVHEFGHSVGLVHRGIPLTSEHQDAENGFHCTNERCVMYFANEVLANLCEFIEEFMANGRIVVFGAECLDDMDALGAE